MAKRRSTAASRRYMEQLPELLLERLLPGAARAGAKVIAEAVKRNLGDKRAEIHGGAKVRMADLVKVRVRRDGDRIIARVALIGPGSYVGRWLEYGTDPHVISVNFAESGGRTARRLNYLERNANPSGRSLFINGRPVGATVFHKGAKPHPFIRPAFDMTRDDAIEAARNYVVSRARRAGVGHNGGPAFKDDA